MGTEASGASQEMLDAADRRVYLPLHGFADSLNLSVAAAMMLQRLIFLKPSLVGSMDEQERGALREDWYSRLARTDKQRAAYMARLQDPPRPFGGLRRADDHRTAWTNKKVKKRMSKDNPGAKSLYPALEDGVPEGPADEQAR